ncbi:MAG: 2'-5' RNA ligase family protein [Acidobacteriota bacterium]
MGSCSAPGEPINQYALVTYFPDELGCFLDQLRRDLVLDCTARSHLSLLPPRSLSVPQQEAESQIQRISRLCEPFIVKVGNVAVFPQTAVIYLEVVSGARQLTSLHDEMSADALAFVEPFPFHPHITLAQNFAVDTVSSRLDAARARWAEYKGPREFLLDRVVFVRNSANNRWTDLRSFPLLGVPSTPGRVPESLLSQTY